MEATSVVVKMFACYWTLLCSIELKGLVYILSGILGANTKWRLLHLKHRHMEAGKLSNIPALVCFQVTITCPVVSQKHLHVKARPEFGAAGPLQL